VVFVQTILPISGTQTVAFQKWAETSPASGLSGSTVSIIGLAPANRKK
jgi:hypothetical protein